MNSPTVFARRANDPAAKGEWGEATAFPGCRVSYDEPPGAPRLPRAMSELEAGFGRARHQRNAARDRLTADDPKWR